MCGLCVQLSRLIFFFFLRIDFECDRSHSQRERSMTKMMTSVEIELELIESKAP